ncbi:hypothetical protein [Xanthobacter versatilis]|uniref:hypothetical protein n=1 Tax=Xanthobacter autotrophicus (strain ATCC BAA-1158 / Py2) TaxID=78245 RepID=UPI00372AB11E
MAEFFGVDTRTIYRWKNSYEDFCQAVTCGKEKADERVARSLFNRAVGYSYESEKVFQFQGEIVRAPVVEHVPPDPSAAMNWLKNRRPDEWRDRQSIDMNAKLDAKVEVSPDAAFAELVGTLEGVARAATANHAPEGAVAEAGAPDADPAAGK